MAGDKVVFVGPSLLRADLKFIPAFARVRSPIRRGDLHLLISGENMDVLIIDGVFGQNFAISPKEVLRCIDAGCAVWGASSMGALRASELDGFGMTGVGLVYSAYRDGVTEDDDEVALIFNAVDHSSISIPLINLRFWNARAIAQGHMCQEEADSIFDSIKRLYYPQRTLETLLESARGTLREADYVAFSSIVVDPDCDQKRLDALEAISGFFAET